jgi:hypothetical protein
LSPHDVRHIAHYGTIFCLAISFSACSVNLRIHHCASLAEQSSINQSISIMVERILGGEGITNLSNISSTAEWHDSPTRFRLGHVATPEIDLYHFEVFSRLSVASFGVWRDGQAPSSTSGLD